MRIVKWILKGVAGVLVLTVVAGVGIALSDWTFFNRLITFDRNTQITDFEWYKPKEAIAGQPDPALEVVAKDQRVFDDEAVAEFIDFAKNQKSVSLLVWQGGALQVEYYGDGYGHDSRTNSASMHKSVLALLIGVLIEEGIIASIDEPAATYITEWADDARSKITIRNLLQMASGLDRPSFSVNPMSDAIKFRLGTNINEIAMKYPALDDPGTYFSYSNANSQILGLIVQRASGMRYAEAMSQYLWSKLGTKTGYVWLDKKNGMPHTSGALLVTAQDWLRLGLLHLNNGRIGTTQIVSEAWMNQITTPSKTNPNYGFQTWLGTTYEELRTYGKGVPAAITHSEPFEADDLVFFDGSGGQRVYIVPSLDLVIVRTGLGGFDPATGSFTWDDSVLPNLVIRALKSSAPTEAPEDPMVNPDSAE